MNSHQRRLFNRRCKRNLEWLKDDMHKKLSKIFIKDLTTNPIGKISFACNVDLKR